MDRGRYRIVVRGEFDRLSDVLTGWRVEASGGETVIDGDVRDQAELHGLLATLRSLGVDIVSVNPCPDEAPEHVRDERRNG